MKTGRLTRAGLVAIMMVLPNTLWNGAQPQANVQVVVRVAEAGPTNPVNSVNRVNPAGHEGHDPADPTRTSEAGDRVVVP